MTIEILIITIEELYSRFYTNIQGKSFSLYFRH